VVAAAMELTDAESKAFWPLYRDYRAALDKINDQRVNLILEYARLYPNIPDLQAIQMLKTYTDLEQKHVAQRTSYLKKFSNVLPATKALRFAQVETRLDLLIHLDLAARIPLTPIRQTSAAPASGAKLGTEADNTIKVFQNADSGLVRFFNNSAGFAVFPSVGKGGLVFGGEYGKGVVYEKGKPSGEATLTEINVGPQIGGQSFYEVIFFETPEALANFKESNFEISAEVSVAAAAEGAALNAKYRDGVLVFTLPRTGLMAQATVGGQKFKYKPFN
jgi:lipid-binding SYLF domain-containing protein